MKLVVHPLQTRLIDMRVDLGRRDAGVPQHLLDLSQVSAAGQQMSCEAVSQRVGTDRLTNVRSCRVLLNQFPDRFSS